MDGGRRAIARAKRWARRICREQTRPGKQRAKNRMLCALYSALPPKADGTHPLDNKNFKLEG